jgi:hypothetical protein
MGVRGKRFKHLQHCLESSSNRKKQSTALTTSATDFVFLTKRNTDSEISFTQYNKLGL